MVGLQKVRLEPGQFVTGRYAGSKEVKMNPSTFWKYLQWLKDNESLDIKGNNKYSLISIVNWELYQLEMFKNDSKSDTNITAKEQQRDTNKNVKNDISFSPKFSDEHMQLALLLKERIIGNKPDYKIRSDINKWANSIRLMVESDKRDPERIRQVIEWCQKDSFWKQNILSVDKLREKFDQLEMKMGQVRTVNQERGKAVLG